MRHAAGRGHEHDRGQHFTVTMPPATALAPRGRLRHYPLGQLPQLIRYQPLNLVLLRDGCWLTSERCAS